MKQFVGILYMFLPIPVFWALYEQQSSRWVFQADKMNGKIGSVEIKPDQMLIINAVFILSDNATQSLNGIPILTRSNAQQNALEAARLAASLYDGLTSRDLSPQQAFAGALAACSYLAENPGDTTGARGHAETVAANFPIGGSIPVNNVNRFFVEKIISPTGED